jgi:hypothetical protein
MHHVPGISGRDRPRDPVAVPVAVDVPATVQPEPVQDPGHGPHRDRDLLDGEVHHNPASGVFPGPAELLDPRHDLRWGRCRRDCGSAGTVFEAEAAVIAEVCDEWNKGQRRVVPHQDHRRRTEKCLANLRYSLRWRAFVEAVAV